MTNLQFLLVIALIFVALMGVVSFVMVQHSRRQSKKDKAKKVYKVNIEDPKFFSEIDMGEVERFALEQLQQNTIRAAEELHEALSKTIRQITEHLDQLVGKDLDPEFEKYHASLEALRTQSVSEFSKLEKELNDKRAERLELLDKEITTEYGKRIDQFNIRLGEVVSSYLLEALGNKVDLGAQSSYIFDVLNEHKEDIKRDVLA